MSKPLPLILTTIQAPTAAVRAFADLDAVELVIVGDAKTPDDTFTGGNWTYLSLEDQTHLPFRLARCLPRNHYARKNLGFLHAIQAGASELAETDDDNRPLEGWSETTQLFHFEDMDGVSGSATVNIYRYFTGVPCWPRGLPLEDVSRSLTEEPPALQPVPARARILQGLANGAPDLDAVHRLVHGDSEVCFKERAPIALTGGARCPFNSQNTFWHRDAFAYLYLPSHVSFRFTDILRGYVAQRGLDALGAHLAFTAASVWQDRNPHNYLRDFEQEIPVYLQAGTVLRVLEQSQLTGQPLQDLETMYADLCRAGVVPEIELQCVRAWTQDLACITS